MEKASLLDQVSPLVPANEATLAITFPNTLKAGGTALFIDVQGNGGSTVSRAKGDRANISRPFWSPFLEKKGGRASLDKRPLNGFFLKNILVPKIKVSIWIPVG